MPSSLIIAKDSLFLTCGIVDLFITIEDIPSEGAGHTGTEGGSGSVDEH